MFKKIKDRFSKNKRLAKKQPQVLRYEELEQRVLFSADVVPGLDIAAVEEQVIVQDVGSDTPVEREAASETVEQAAEEARSELVFVNESVTDHEQLIADLQGGDANRIMEVVVLESDRNGIEQVSEILSERSGLAAVHIFSHGSDGAVKLGNTWLNADNIDDYSDRLNAWSDSLDRDADILIYGCSLAESETGENFVNQLSQLTGADVAASDDKTGHTSLSGDWELEYQRGEIETSVAISTAAQQNWAGTLQVETFQEGVNGYASTVDTYINEGSPASGYGNYTSLIADSTPSQQVLIRFDDIFGSGPNQIPPGSIINSASLDIYVTSSVNAGTVSLHSMLIDWGDIQSWNSIGSGIQVDGSDANATADSSISSSNTLYQTFTGLATTLQAWSDEPATNYGWVMEINKNGTWAASSSEGALNQPRLTVDFTPANTPPTIDLDADNSSGATGSDFATSWTEAGGAVAIVDASDATLTDTDDTHLESLTVTITYPADAPNEILGYDTTGTSIVGSYDTATGVLSLTGTDTVANYQTVLRTITYNNTSSVSDDTARTITFVAHDGFGNSNTAKATVTITATNDAPVNTAPASWSTSPDFPIVFSTANGNAISISDPDASTIEVTLTATNGTVSLNLDGHVSAETLINTTTADVQEQPDIAVAADGSYVVAWASQGQDSEGFGIYAQRYDATGKAVGDEIQIHTYEAGDQTNPSIAIDDSGNFVVAWQTDHLGSGYFNIYARRFAADGTALDANEFRVDAAAGADVINADVAMDSDGDFVIAFENHVPFDSDGWSINARQYNSDGTDRSGPFQVNTTVLGNQAAPSLAMDDVGNYVVAWLGPSGADNAIFYQRFDNSIVGVGGKLGSEMIATTAGFNARVTSDATGDFVIVWQGTDTSNWAIKGRQFNADGSPVATEFQINTHETDAQVYPDIAMNDNGEFIVVWESYSQDAAGTYGVYGQRYDASGNTVDDEFLVNSMTDGTQRTPAVALADSGRFTVTWSGNGDGDATGVFTKSYGLAVGFTDGDGTDDANMTFTGTVADINTALEGLTFTPTASYNGPASLRIQTSDLGQTGTGGTKTDDDTIDIAVGTVSVAPIITLPGSALNYTENDGAVVIDSTATVSDPDSADFNLGTLTVDFTAGSTANDRLEIRDQGAGIGNIQVSGNNISYQPGGSSILIGTFTGGTDGTTPLVITLNAAADSVAVQALMRNITYENVSENPNISARTVRFVLTDGDGGTSAAVTETINVGAVNDDPTDEGTMPNDLVFLEDTQGKLNLSGIDLSDVDAGSGDLTLTITSDNGHLQTMGWSGLTLVSTQSSLELTGNLTDLNDFLNDTDSIDYEHATPNRTGNNVDVITIEITDNGNTGSGGGSTIELGTVNIDITAANDAPTAADNTVSADENTAYAFNTGDFNFSDIDGDTLDSVKITSLETVGSLKLSGGDVTLNQVISKANIDAGNLTFTPVADESGVGYDSFEFSVNDGTVDSVSSYTMTIDVTAANVAPIVDLNGSDGGGTDFTVTFTEDGGAVNVTDTDAIISDADDTFFQNLGINLFNMSDGASEQIVLAGYTFAYGTSDVVTRTIGSTDFEIDFDGTGFSIVNDVGGNMPLADLQSLIRGITYENTSQNPTTGDRTIDIEVQDASGLGGPTSTSTITVTAVNDAPLINTLNGAPTFTEDGAAVVLDVDVDVSDSELDALNSGLGNYDGASLTLVRNGGATSEDVISFNDGNGISLSGGNLIKNSQIIATFDITTTTGQLVITFTDTNGETPISADVDNILRQITYANSSDTPPASVQIDWTFDDGNAGSQGTGGALQATGSTTVNITAVDDTAPTQVNNTGSTVSEGATHTITNTELRFDDSVQPASSVTYTVTTSPTNGQLELTTNPDVAITSFTQAQIDANKVVYVHDGSATTSDEFKFDVDDGQGNSVTGQYFAITVTPVNDAPLLIGANDLTTINEDPVSNNGTLVSDLIAGQVTDQDAGALSGIAVTAVDDTNGTWQFTTNSGGLWTDFAAVSESSARLLTADANTYVRFVPNADWNGTVTNGITFHAWDQTSGTSGSSADLTSVYTLLDQFSVVSYSNNDGTASWISDWIETNDDGVASTSNIRIENNKLRLDNLDGGTFSSITRTADLTAATTAILSLDYDGIREGVVGGDRFTVEVSDNGGATWALLEEITVPGETTANLPFSGSLSYTLEDSVTFTNDMELRLSISAGFGGTDQHVYFDNVQIQYTAIDQIGGSTAFSTATASSSIIVNPVNDAPTGTTLVVAANEETLTPIDISANVADVDGTVDLATTAITGTTSNGTLINNGDGTFNYTGNTDFVGTDSFTYTVEDNDGQVSSDITVTINVADINDAPTGTTLVVAANEETLTPIDISANVADVDGTVDLATTTIAGGTTNGTLINNNDGTFTYTGNTDFVGTDSFTYTVEDNDGQVSSDITVTINVADINDAPTGTTLVVAASEETLTVIDISANVADVDGTVDLATTTITGGTTNGSLINNGDGTFNYTGNTDFVGTDSFTYTVEDNDGQVSSDITVTINVSDINDAPTGTTLVVAASEETLTVIDISGNVADIDGTVDLTTTAITGTTSNGTLINNNDGTFTYTGNTDFVGTDSFTYTVEDNDGQVSSDITVTINVADINDAPTGTTLVVAANEETLTPIDISANVADVDGTVDLATTAITGGPSNGSLINNSDGTFNYTGNTDFVGTDSFTYTVEDNDGQVSSDITVTINVSDINDAPTGTTLVVAASEETLTVIDISGNVADIDGTVDLTTTAITGTTSNGTLINNSDGTFNYTGNIDFVGTDSFTYTVEDNDGQVSSDITVTINVSDINDAPTGTTLVVAASEETLTVIDISGNVADIDGTVDLTTTAITGTTSNGTLINNNDGTFTYTGNTDFVGTDSFTYTVEDNDGQVSSDITVTINVADINDAPTGTTLVVAASEETLTVIDISGNVADIDGTVDLTTTAITGTTSNGSLINNGDGTFNYTGNTDFVGTDSFTYTVEDNDGQVSSDITVTINVSDINDAPTGTTIVVAASEETLTVIDISGNVADIDGTVDLSTTTITGTTSNGSLINNSDGTFNYTGNTDFVGTDSFTYTVEDNDGQVSSDITVTINVADINDAPTGTTLVVAANEETLTPIDIIANVADVDGTVDLATTAITGTTSNGTLINNSDGTFNYTGNIDFVGTDSFTYTVEDNDGQVSSDITVTINVADINDAPTGTTLVVAASEETLTVIGISGNVADIDGTVDLTTTAITGGPSNGSLINNGDGTFNYTGNTDFVGTDSFTYTVEDNDGQVSSDITVTINVSDINDAPTGTTIVVAASEETLTVIDISGNVADIDGTVDLTTTAITGTTSNGTLINNSDGTFNYTGNIDFVGTDSFTYTVEDNDGQVSSDITVTINVADINDAPTGTTLVVAASEETLTVIDISGNVADIDGTVDLTTTAITGTTSNGSLINNGDGTFNYTGNTDFVGTDSFTYTVEDNDGQVSSDITVTINVSDINDAPTGTTIVVAASEETLTVIDISGNVADVDGTVDLATTTITGGTTNGTLINNGDGTFNYTGNTDFVGTDSFTYTVEDNDGQVSSDITVTINVADINDAPTGTTLVVAANEETLTPIDISANVADVDGTVDLATTTIAGGTTNGSLINNGDGTFNYTGNTDFVGTDSFTYTVEDNDGQVSSDITVTINVSDINDAPTGTTLVVAASEETLTVIDISGNVADVDGTVDLATTTITGGTTNGTLINNGDGTFNYTGNTDFVGTDSFTYTVEDNDGQVSSDITVTINVADINDAPTGTTLVVAASEETLTVIDISGNVADIDGTVDLTTTAITGGPSNGSLINNGDGTFNYTGNTDFVGTDSFTYTVEDNDGQVSSDITVTINVSDINDAPTGTTIVVAASEETLTVIDISGNVADVDGTVDLATTTITGGTTNGTLINNGDGTFNYTGNTDFVGTDSFTYTVEDNDGQVSSDITVTINVADINDAPTGTTLVVAANEETLTPIDISGNVADIDGTVDLTTTAITGGPSNGSLINNGDGTFNYTGNTDFVGTDSFTYTVEDNDGQVSSDITVTINVADINDAPTGTTLVVAASEETLTVIDISGNVTDVDGMVDLSTTTITGTTSNGSLINNGDGTFNYTGNTDFVGTDSFTYTVEDNDGQVSSDITVTINVADINDAPTGTTLVVAASEETLTVIDISGNVADIDGTVDLTTTAITGGPSNGSLINNGDGTFNYTGNTDFVGTDSFTYTVEDNDGQVSSDITVTINVSDINDAPTGTTIVVAASEETLTVIDISGNVADVDGTVDLATTTITGGTTNGTLINNGDGTFTYTGNTDFVGTDSFTYTVEDNDGQVSSDITVTINVADINDAPTGTTLVVAASEETLTVIDISGNVADIDGTVDLTTTAITGGPSNGSLINNGDGTFNYTGNTDFVGTDSFTYTVEDNDGQVSSDITVTINVSDINDAPTGTTIVVAASEETLTVIDISGNVADVDGTVDLATTTITGGTTNGTLINNGDGTFTYTGNTDFVGTDSFTYTVEDNDGQVSSDITVTINVADINDAPTGTTLVVAANEETLTPIDISANVADVDGTVDLATTTIAGGTTNGTLINNNDGTFTYTGNTDFVGTDSFTYTVEDNDGQVSSDITVTINVSDINDAPTGTTLVVAASEETLTVIDISGNVADIDGTVDLTTTAITGTTSNGTLINNSDGTFNYTGNTDFVGTDSFTYTVEDNDGQVSSDITVTINVSDINDAPTGTTLVVAASEETLTVIDISGNVADIDGTVDLTTTAITGGPSNGSLINNGDGTFNYTGNTDFVGTDSFTYTVEDNDGQVSSDITVTINVADINDAPTGTTLVVAASEETLTVIDISGNVTDVDGMVDLSTTTITGTTSNGSLINNGDGTFNYTGNTDFVGTDSFTYTVEDNDGQVSSDITVTINVADINDAPTIESTIADQNLAEDFASYTIDLNAAFADVETTDANLVYGVSGNTNINVSITGGIATITPSADWNGSETLTFSATDQGALSVSQDVVFAVSAQADIADDTAVSVTEDTPTIIAVLANDSFEGSAVVTATTAPANGAVVINGDNTITYTPNANYTGADSFTYTVTSGGVTETATVTVNVTAVNDAPSTTPVNLTAIIEDGGARLITQAELLANATDVDGPALTATNLTISAGSGTLVDNSDGTWDYTSAANDDTSVSFTYTVTDGSLTATGSATLDITPVNDAPVTNNDSATVDEGQNVVINLVGNDADVENALDFSSITIIAAPTNGSLVDNGDGTLTYGHDGSKTISDSFSYTINDVSGAASNIASVSLTVNPANDNDPGDSTDPDPILLEDPVTDEDEESEVGEPTYEAPGDDPFTVDEVVSPVEAFQTPQDIGNADESIVEIKDPQDEETEEIIYLTDEIDRNAQSEEREDDRGYTYYDNDLYKDMSSLKYWNLIDNAAQSEPVAVNLDDISFLDFDSDDTNPVIANDDYDLLRQEIDESFNSELEGQGIKAKIVTVTAATFTVGIVSYLLRAGSLVASMMSALPLWRGFDPIAIFSGDKKKKKKQIEISDAGKLKSEAFFEGDAE